MALTKAHRAESLFNELGLNKREALELVDLYFHQLVACLALGEPVKRAGFGNFDFRDQMNVQAGTRKPGTKFRLAHGVS